MKRGSRISETRGQHDMVDMDPTTKPAQPHVASAVDFNAPEPMDPPWTLSTPLRFPFSYMWFVLVSSLDIILTWKILAAGGSEVNPVANRVIEMWGLPGAIAFKFGVTLFVILVCEIVARPRLPLARTLSILAIVISSVPVVYSLLLLAL